LETEAGEQDFDRFVREVEPRLRRALIGTYGAERGREATAEALAWAYEHRSDLDSLRNPAAYLFQVGRSRTRLRRQRRLFERPVVDEPWVEPRLARALEHLSATQRTAVLLVHGAGMTVSEAAEVLGVRRWTLEKRVQRGVARLQVEMNVESKGREREHH
jgi:DNA-directed RNA polymerase specialized sigma24 family protein